MFLLEKMELYPFSAGEQTVVDFILTQREAIATLTTQQIAEQAYASKSTLVRISQKLGFQGWTDFKTAFLEELHYLNLHAGGVDANIPFERTDNYLQIAGKIAAVEKEAIDDTLELLSPKLLNQAIKLLKQAKTIHIFAASNNLLLAQEFGHNLSRIQKDVRIHQLHGEVLFNAYLADVNSCALLISYSGGTESLLRIAKLLNQKDIPILLLTSLGDNPLAALADCTLRLATREKLYSKIGTFSTDASINYLLNTLYSCLFAQDYDHNLELRRLSSQLIETERKTSSAILSENH